MRQVRPTKFRILSAVALHTLFAIAFVIPAAGNETNAHPEQVLSCDWMIGLQQQLKDMGIDLNAERASEATALALVKTIDPHAITLSTADWETLKNRREGLADQCGITLGMTNGLPLINSLPDDSPASVVGLQVGDVITGIGTQSFQKIALPTAQRLLQTGNAGTVTITYARSGLTNVVQVSLVQQRQTAIEVAELLPNNIGYIKVNGLYPGSGKELVTRMRAWSETKRDGIVLDLRGAGGGDDAAAAQTAGLFCQSGQFLFAYRDFHQQDLHVFKAPENQAIDLPLMVLIDRHTTGSSETLAAALNGAARSALLVGERTAGDFNLRDAVNLSSQTVYMATRILDTADGFRYNGHFGLEPSVVIDQKGLDTHDYEPPVDLLDRRVKMEIEERDMATRRRIRGDGVLERAIDILIGLKSLNKKSGALSSPEMLQDLL